MEKIDKYLESCKIEDFEIESYTGETVMLSELIEIYFQETTKKGVWLDISEHQPLNNRVMFFMNSDGLIFKGAWHEGNIAIDGKQRKEFKFWSL